MIFTAGSLSYIVVFSDVWSNQIFYIFTFLIISIIVKNRRVTAKIAIIHIIVMLLNIQYILFFTGLMPLYPQTTTWIDAISSLAILEITVVFSFICGKSVIVLATCISMVTRLEKWTRYLKNWIFCEKKSRNWWMLLEPSFHTLLHR